MKDVARMATWLVLILGAAGVPAARAQKQTPPEGGPAKAFTVPANETYTLSNGLKVTLVPYGLIPKAALRVAVDAGGLNEGNGRIGVADLTAELLKEGTAALSAEQVAEEAARMGSTLEVSSGADQTTLGLDVLEEFAPDAVRLLADVLEHPRLPESELARLKNNMLRQIAVRGARPQTIALGDKAKIQEQLTPYEGGK